MKLNFGRRFVLFLHWLLSLLICAFVLLNLVSPQIGNELASWINAMLGAGLAEIAGIALLAFYALFAVLTIVMIFGRKDKKRDRGFITVDSSESGKTRIAIGAVDQMIRQAVRGVEGITEMKATVINNQDNISVNCSVGVASGLHVPTVTMNVQRAIRSYIELNCGVAVREVSVSVHSLQTEDGVKGRRKGSAPAAVVPAPQAIIPEEAKQPEPAPVKEEMGPPDEPAYFEDVQEEAVTSAETAEVAEAELPEIEPIVLTLDPPAEVQDGEEPETAEE